jgi:AFG3 family protein
MIDEEARAIVAAAYARTTQLINEKRAQLNLLAEKLIEQEVRRPAVLPQLV